MKAAKPYYRPRPAPAPLARQAACLRTTAEQHGYGYWSYLARYGDITAFQMSGALPDCWKWFDLPETLLDAADTLDLLDELARLQGDEAVRSLLRAAIERARGADGAGAS